MSGNGRSQAKVGTKGMGRKGQPRSQAGGGRMEGVSGGGGQEAATVRRGCHQDLQSGLPPLWGRGGGGVAV